MEELKIAIKLGFPVINLINSDTYRSKLELLFAIEELKYDIKLKTVGFKFIPNEQNIAKIVNEYEEADRIIIFDPYFAFKPKEKIPVLKEITDYLKENGIIYVISDPEVNENEIYSIYPEPLSDERIEGIILTELEDYYITAMAMEQGYNPDTKPIFNKTEIKKLVNLFKGMSIPEIQNYTLLAAEKKVRNNNSKKRKGIEIFKEIEKEKLKILRDNNLSMLETIKPEEVGGLDNLKDYIKIIKNAWDKKLPVKGIFLQGLPGTGKTTFAKVVANVLGVPLIQFDIGRIFNKYVGESERKMYYILEKIEAFAPMVLLIDEIDKIFNKSNSDSGVSDRILGIFLNWLQERKEKIYLIATANGSIPLELQRAGRFDRKFFVDFPNKDERKKIIQIHLDKMKKLTKINYDVNIEEIVKATQYFTGAEIEQLIKESFYAYLDRKEIKTDNVLDMVKYISPIYKTDPQKVENIRNLIKYGFVPANNKMVEEDYIEENKKTISKKRKII